MPEVHRIAVVLLVSAAATGCGGGSSKDDAAKQAPIQIRRAFDAYRTAVIRADFRGACRALAPSEARKAQALVRSLAIGGERSCTSALRTLSGLSRAQGQGAEILDTLRRSRVISVRVAGDRARLRYRTPKGVATAGAERVGGRWRVTGVTGS